MKRHIFILLSALMLALPITGHADDDFYGKIESRPDGKVGQWLIGGKAVNATAETELDEDNGVHNVGACVEVEIDDGVVEEIETENMRKCEANR